MINVTHTGPRGEGTDQWPHSNDPPREVKGCTRGINTWQEESRFRRDLSCLGDWKDFT